MGSAGFVALGIALGLTGKPEGLLAVAFFGLCAVVFAVQLHPGASWLEIHDDHLELCTLFRRSQIPFERLAGFSVFRMRLNKMIALRYEPEAPRASARALARGFTGAEGCLPDTYGWKAEALCNRLNDTLGHWRTTR